MTTESKPARRRYHKGNVAEDLMAVAVRILETERVEDLSVRRLAREVGVTPANFYNHFVSLNDLLLDLAADAFEDSFWSGGSLDDLFRQEGDSPTHPIAAVFVNRLRRGMLLQTDPTVIYGIGEAFDGNLRKRDLVTDTPYNTYTRGGLPPTPIAMPGLASLQAAMHPPKTAMLYFVARGDGSSEFSRTLDEHNRAVTKNQRGR